MTETVAANNIKFIIMAILYNPSSLILPIRIFDIYIFEAILGIEPS